MTKRRSELLFEYLEKMGISGEVLKNQDLLTSICEEVLEARTMDTATLIYRLAMMIYHAPKLAGAPLIEALEDPSRIYLQMRKDKKIREEILDKARTLPIPIRATVKTIATFLIASFIYELCKEKGGG